MKSHLDAAQRWNVEPYNTADFSAISLKQIDDACVHFEKAWKSGGMPALEDYLEGFDSGLRSPLLVELLLLDIEYRTRAGQSPNPTDYETRFPGETPAIESAFKSTRDNDSGPLAVEGNEQLPPFHELSLTSQFQLRQFHAQGGLGVIYVARDETLGREVAVKFCRSRFRNSVEQRRLAREARITGRLAHPGIVSVLASGLSSSGLPCYVMPLIDGQTLHRAIRDFHDTIEETPANNPFAAFRFRQLLQRFIAVCNTVAYAHDQGVIHRDIKPGNVMLGRFGETFLVDWGLAKSLRPDDARDEPESSRLAGDGQESNRPLPEQTLPGQQIGTPAFASPEQVAGDVDQHDVRSDIFSLGATLYCLLVGQGPVKSSDLTSRKSASVLRDVPAPRKLNRAVPAELEAICLKAMAFEPPARYASALLLANDIEHYLADEPVDALPEPVTKHAGRWLRKHPRVVAGVASALIVTLFSLAIGSYVLGKKNRQLIDSNNGLVAAQKSRTQAQTETMETLRTLTDEAIQRWLAREEVLSGEDRAFVESILTRYERFATISSNELDAIEAKAEGYYRVGQLYALLDNKPASIDAWTRGLETISGFSNAHSANLQDLQSRTQSGLAILFAQMGDFERGRSLIEAAAAIELQLTRVFPEVADYKVEYARRLNQLGDVFSQAGDWPAAEKQFRESLQLVDGIAIVKGVDDVGLNKLRAGTLHNLGLALWQSGRFTEARQPLESSLERHREIVRQSSRITYRVDMGRVLATLGAVHRELKDGDSAQASFDEAIAVLTEITTAWPSLAEPLYLISAAHKGLAGVQYDQGRFEDSLVNCVTARSFVDASLNKSPGEVKYQENLAEICAFQGAILEKLKRPDEAERCYREGLKIAEKLFNADPQIVHRERSIRLLKLVGALRFQQRQLVETLELMHRALDLIEELQETPARHNLVFDEVGCNQFLGWCLIYSGKLEEGARHWRRIIKLTEDKPIILQGENTLQSARVYLAICIARTDPIQSLNDVEALAVKSDLLPVQVYSLSCAAAMASQYLNTHESSDEKQAAGQTALELLERSFEEGYFSNAATLKSLKGNPSFKGLFDHDEFKRIEKLIALSLDESE